MAELIKHCKSVMKDASKEFGVSDVTLSVKTFKGHPFLVDGDGKLISGVINASVSGGIDECTTATIKLLVR